MDSIKQALLVEAATGKVRADKIYKILMDLVDAVQTQTPAVVQCVPQTPEVAAPVPEVEVQAPEVQAPAPAKTFGRSA
jgi:hypothetical protein